MITVVMGLMVSACIGMQAGAFAVNQNDKAEIMIKVDDTVYFEMPAKLPDPLREAVLGVGAGEIRIATPKTIDLKAHKTIPVLFAAGQTEVHSELVPSSLNTTVLSVDLDSGFLQMANAFPIDATKTYPQAPPRTKVKFFPKDLQGVSVEASGPGVPPPPPLPSPSIAQRWLDVLPLEGLNWKPGQYAVRILMYDGISNLALVDVVESEQIEEKVQGYPADKAYAIEMEARRIKSASDIIRSFGARTETPQLGKRGVQVSIPDHVRPKAEIPLHGAARLSLGAAMIIDPRRFSGEIQTISEDDLPGAVVPVSILISALDQVPPIQVEILVPYSEGELKEGAEMDIFFSLDLNSCLKEPLSEGTYFVYALAGQYATEAHRIDVKAEK